MKLLMNFDFVFGCGRWILQDATLGSLLLGEISYGEVSVGNKGGNGGAACPAKSTLSFVVPPAPKVCLFKLHSLVTLFPFLFLNNLTISRRTDSCSSQSRLCKFYVNIGWPLLRRWQAGKFCDRSKSSTLPNISVFVRFHEIFLKLLPALPALRAEG